MNQCNKKKKNIWSKKAKKRKKEERTIEKRKTITGKGWRRTKENRGMIGKNKERNITKRNRMQY